MRDRREGEGSLGPETKTNSIYWITDSWRGRNKLVVFGRAGIATLLTNLATGEQEGKIDSATSEATRITIQKTTDLIHGLFSQGGVISSNGETVIGNSPQFTLPENLLLGLQTEGTITVRAIKLRKRYGLELNKKLAPSLMKNITFVTKNFNQQIGCDITRGGAINAFYRTGYEARSLTNLENCMKAFVRNTFIEQTKDQSYMTEEIPYLAVNPELIVNRIMYDVATGEGLGEIPHTLIKWTHER